MPGSFPISCRGTVHDALNVGGNRVEDADFPLCQQYSIVSAILLTDVFGIGSSLGYDTFPDRVLGVVFRNSCTILENEGERASMNQWASCNPANKPETQSGLAHSHLTAGKRGNPSQLQTPRK